MIRPDRGDRLDRGPATIRVLVGGALVQPAEQVGVAVLVRDDDPHRGGADQWVGVLLDAPTQPGQVVLPAGVPDGLHGAPPDGGLEPVHGELPLPGLAGRGRQCQIEPGRERDDGAARLQVLPPGDEPASEAGGAGPPMTEAGERGQRRLRGRRGERGQ